MNAMTLIYQPVEADGESTAFADALREVAFHTSELRLVSPFLGFGVLDPLTRGRRFRLVTDLEACFEAGVDDKLISFMLQHLGFIRDAPGVHAKVVLGETAALVGSANLTQQAICNRMEMACLLRGEPHTRRLFDWFDTLWDSAGVVKESDIRSLEQAARTAVAAQSAGSARPTRPLRTQRGSLGWLASPMSKSPATAETMAPTTWSPLDLPELDELADQIGRIARSRSESLLILNMLREALEVAGLDVDDDRLHLNFGKGRVSITVGQRHVSWYGPSRRVGGTERYMGFLLDDFGAVKDATQKLSGADSDASSRAGQLGEPILYVPFDQLLHLPDRARQSWYRGIRAAVDRAGPSPCRAKKRSSLYFILKHRDGLAETTRRAFPQGWWFGVNNGSRGHMRVDDVLPLLRRERTVLEWPIGHSKPRKAYREMLPGDRVLVWTGHGKNPAWGLLGTTVIVDVQNDRVVLGEGAAFEEPLTPYPKGQPKETDTVRFLRDQLGDDFAPLGDVLRAVFSTPRRPPVTIAPVAVEALERITARGERRWAPPRALHADASDD